MEETDESFSTKDIFEAAYLYTALKICPRITKKDSENFYWFTFPDSDNCRSLIEAYWSQRASVDPKSYADAFRSMKDLLFNVGMRPRRR